MVIRDADFPPVWLAAFALGGFVLGKAAPKQFAFGYPLAALLVIIALVILLVAVLQMILARTPLAPERVPTRLLTNGMFRFSRNPIYLADAILLAGLDIYWDAWLALPFVGLFMLLISRRFIDDEEATLAREFGAEYEDYKKRTRRWI